ncbi:jg619, partial [Pararge aegeria aegeria]
MANLLRTVYWNANGLTRKATLVRSLLKEQDIDIALINETHLSPRFKLQFPGYFTYRLDDQSPGPTSKRGLAVLVRRRIVHQPIPALQLQSLQALGVELLIAGKPHRLFAIYRPPGSTLILREVHSLLDSPYPTILAGDWNAKHPAWHSRKTCSTGRRLLDDAACQLYEVTGPQSPTHYPFLRTLPPDVIDLVVSKGLENPPALEVLVDELGSDHLPVLATYDAGTHATPQPPPRTRVDWKLFEQKVRESSITRPTTTPEDVESLAKDLTSTIAAAQTQASTTDPDPGPKSPLPYRLRLLIEKKRRLRRQWQSTRCPTLKRQLNRLVEEVGQIL